MSVSRLPIIALLAASIVALSACANTIRGIGRDASATVDATEEAVEDVAE